MSFPESLKFTSGGKEVNLKALAGRPLIFTTVRLGDGNMTGTISGRTSLISERASVTVNAVSSNDKYATIDAVFKNNDLSDGFYWRELGVYVADPDDPENRDADILYCYQNAESLAEYIPAPSSAIIEKIIHIPIFVGDAENVSVAVNGIVQQEATVTQEEETDIASDDYLSFYDKSDVKNKKISFADLKEKFTSFLVTNLSNHIIDKKNPHAVTAEQAGAAKKEHSHTTSEITDIDSVHNVTTINYSDFIKGSDGFDPRGLYEKSGKMVTGTIIVSVNVTTEMIENESNGYYNAGIGTIASGYRPATIKYVPVLITKKFNNDYGVQFVLVQGVIFTTGGVMITINNAVSGTAYIPISYLTA